MDSAPQKRSDLGRRRVAASRRPVPAVPPGSSVRQIRSLPRPSPRGTGFRCARREAPRLRGPLDSGTDEGPREAAYLTAIEAFARELGVTRLHALRLPDPTSSPG